MAVVQISKIQVRRGQKNSNNGIPQLSSAEFAWAVDSQELYIGNGSVLEGAPYVGNTKILTEHDNLLALASSYQFAFNDTSITQSVPRSLQTKIDEIQVSVVDFGAVGDGFTDCTDAFESAFTDLFRNTNNKFKKILIVPNGRYLFTGDLNIPSGVIIQGETKSGAVLDINTNNVAFVTATGEQFLEFTEATRPTNLHISNLTIERTTGQIILSGIADSYFADLKITGGYSLLDEVVSLGTEPSALYWENAVIATTNIEFVNCEFKNNSIAIKCLQTTAYKTQVKFDNCHFTVSNTSVYVDAMAGQHTAWNFDNCTFEQIDKQAFRSTNGHGTVIQQSQFKLVGNAGVAASTPNEVMVYFGEVGNNQVVDCSSDRHQAVLSVVTESTPSYPEVQNGSKVNFTDRNHKLIALTDSITPLTVFSSQHRFIVVNYLLVLGDYSRYGSLTLAVSDNLTSTDQDNEVTLTDSYTYSSNRIVSAGGLRMTNFEFSVSKKRNINVPTPGADTILISYVNPLLSGTTGSITYDVTYGV
jgi:hypothetical protein